MRKRFLFVLLLIANMILQSGCAAMMLGAAIGAGGVAYFKGNLEKNLDHPVKSVHKAALSALKKLKIIVVNEKLDIHSSKIKAKFSDHKDVHIDIKALTAKSSKIKIRVGALGDEDSAKMILNVIEKKL